MPVLTGNHIAKPLMRKFMSRNEKPGWRHIVRNGICLIFNCSVKSQLCHSVLLITKWICAEYIREKLKHFRHILRALLCTVQVFIKNVVIQRVTFASRPVEFILKMDII